MYREENILNSNMIISTEIYVFQVSAKWCNPCQQMKPIFQDISQLESMSKYNFWYIDTDVHQELFQWIIEKCGNKYRISSIPTFLVMKNNNIVSSLSGRYTQENLHDFITSSINSH